MPELRVLGLERDVLLEVLLGASMSLLPIARSASARSAFFLTSLLSVLERLVEGGASLGHLAGVAIERADLDQQAGVVGADRGGLLVQARAPALVALGLRR